MAECPFCKIVYSKETVICPECGAEVEQNQVEEKEHLVKERKEQLEKVNWVRLQSTLNDIEADIISGLLETNGIPVMRKYPGMSGLTKIYMGSSFGVELYIPDKYLKEAKALLVQNQQEWETD